MTTNDPRAYLLEDLDTALAAYNLRRTGTPTDTGGSLNLNLRVPVEPTTEGPSTTEATTVFARRNRADLDLARIHREHAITAWVAERDIPAIAPLATAEGGTVIEANDDRWSLFPWIDGRAPIRGEITSSEATAIGEVHGRIMRALAEHPETSGQVLGDLGRRVRWDIPTTLETIDRLDRAAADAAADSDRDPAVVGLIRDTLAFNRELLRSDAPRPFSELAWLPVRLLHGDFHDQQVLLNQSNQVVAVVDWEMTQPSARLWELIRGLSFAMLLETEHLEHYLEGFARQVTYPATEVRAALELWWQIRLHHGTWAFDAYLLQHNDRVAAFFPEENAHLHRLADPQWRTHIADRLVAVVGTEA